MKAPTSLAAGPLSAIAFTAAIFAAALSRESNFSNAVSIGVLGGIAVGAAYFGRPIAALAASIAPALFADHFFVPPFDQINFASRDLAVLLGIPMAAITVSVCVLAAVRLAAFVQRHRTPASSSFDRWLIELSEPAHTHAERHSIG